ncbi:MAG TPA: ADOP family duplicated permease [Gemmatimonadaceae bacterium]|nr:ADOP family duplicated permease [Gemmatimonadaceae bacterium]
MLELFRDRLRDAPASHRPFIALREIGGAIVTAVRARHADPWTRATDPRRLVPAPSRGNFDHPTVPRFPLRLLESPRGMTVEQLWCDARMSLRIFRRSPALALSAVIALAMGIGFTTTMFSIVRGGTRPLPVENPDQIVALTRTSVRGYDVNPSPFDYRLWSRVQRSYTGLGAFEEQSMNLGGDDTRPERRTGAFVTPSTFSLLGIQPLLGRVIVADDSRPDAPPVVVLGHDLWQARFAGDSTIIGREVRIDGTPRTVVGIMPPRFGFPVRSAMWLPLVVEGDPAPTAQVGGMRVFGRLKDGVTPSQARGELATVAAGVAREHPATHKELSARVIPFAEVEMDPNTHAILYLMLGVVSFVLLIACANVANLLLARAAARTRELAVRTALGASRARIVALHITESAALAVAGGLLGIVIANTAVRFFAAATADILDAYWIDFRVDWAVLIFATVTVAVAGIAAGLLPGLRASATNVVEVLKDATGGSTGLRVGRIARALVLVEVALATGFLIMTMTFTKTAVALRAIDFPFDARRIFVAQLGLSQSALSSVEGRERLVRDLTTRLEATPGVAASALVSVAPGRGAGNWTFSLDTPPSTATAAGQPTTGLVMITPGFFEVVGARVLRGRGIEWSDTPGGPLAAVVNESWVSRFSPGREPIGRRIWLGERMLEVVGVVPDLQMQDPEDRRGDGVYVSMLQSRPVTVRVLARGQGDPLALTPVVRDAVESIDRDLPLFEVSSLYDAIYSEKKVLDAFGALFFAAGVGALLLTMVGLYGIVSFAVASRTREIGVRVALGASRGAIARLVIGQGSRLIGIGVAVGLVIAVGLSHALAAATEFFQPAGAPTYVAIAGALVATAAAALVRPVRRALALAPVDALRRE